MWVPLHSLMALSGGFPRSASDTSLSINLSDVVEGPSSADSTPRSSAMNTPTSQVESAIPSHVLLREESLRTIARRRRPSAQVSLSQEERTKDFRDFNVVLREPVLCAGFRNYLRSSFCEENLDFWKKVEWFRLLPDQDVIQHEAQLIFDQFLRSDSPQTVNVSHEIRDVLAQHLASGKPISNEFFDPLRQEIFVLMRSDSFRAFTLLPAFTETCEIYSRVRCLRNSAVQVLPTNDQKLEERDWQLLLSGSTGNTLNEGSFLLLQGQPSGLMYRVEQGQVEVSETNQKGDIKRSIRGRGSIIGEMGLLGEPSQYSAVCLSEVVVREINFAVLWRLFGRERELGQRFYYMIGRDLANQLELIASPNHSNVVPTPGVPAAKEDISGEEGFQQLFGLLEEEFLLKEYPCSCNRIITRKGRLYISRKGVYFFARVFGLSTKERISLARITSLKLKTYSRANSVLVLEEGRRRFRFSLDLSDALNANALLEDLREAIMPSTDISGSPPPPMRLLSRARTVNSDYFDPQEESSTFELTSRDWDILISGGVDAPNCKRDKTLMTFTEGDVIIEEGKPIRMVGHIASGTCRVAKALSSGQASAVLGYLQEGDTFGEINFLTGALATASVIAETTVDLYIINYSIRETVFPYYPQVAIRFFHYLCVCLYRRIIQREEEGWGQ